MKRRERELEAQLAHLRQVLADCMEEKWGGPLWAASVDLGGALGWNEPPREYIGRFLHREDFVKVVSTELLGIISPDSEQELTLDLLTWRLEERREGLLTYEDHTVVSLELVVDERGFARWTWT